MIITIFGARGAISRLLIRQALDSGLNVRAYVRNQSKVYLKHQNLAIIQGDLNNLDKTK